MALFHLLTLVAVQLSGLLCANLMWRSQYFINVEEYRSYSSAKGIVDFVWIHFAIGADCDINTLFENR